MELDSVTQRLRGWLSVPPTPCHGA